MKEGKEATICRPPNGFPNNLGEEITAEWFAFSLMNKSSFPPTQQKETEAGINGDRAILAREDLLRLEKAAWDDLILGSILQGKDD